MTHSAGNFTFSGLCWDLYYKYIRATFNFGGFVSTTNDVCALGSTGLSWSDLFLASGCSY